MINLVKKHFKALLILLVLVFVIAFFLSGNKKTITPIQNTGPSWKELTPGKSSKEDVVKKLGEPINDEGGVLTFKSSSEVRLNEVYIASNSASLIKEVVTLKDKQSADDLIKTYGPFPDTLYGPDASSGVYLFVNPTKGVAYLGNPVIKSLVEIWYFQPTSLDEFIANLAPDYSKTSSSDF